MNAFFTITKFVASTAALSVIGTAVSTSIRALNGVPKNKLLSVFVKIGSVVTGGAAAYAAAPKIGKYLDQMETDIREIVSATNQLTNK